MISLTDQLIEQLQELFSNREDSYNKTIVKEIYKSLPKGTYPKITIQEIDNSEEIGRTTAEGEQTTALSYQIICYSRDTEEYDYIDSVKFMAGLVNDFIDGNYKMQRLGSPVLQPYISDKTIMTYTMRYSCVYDKETNLIYIN